MEDTPSGIFLCWAASSCLSAVSQRLFTFPSSMDFLSSVQRSVLGPDALHTYLLTFGPSHPGHFRATAVPSSSRILQHYSCCSCARLPWSYVRAAELACGLGGTYLLTSWPGVMCVWLCQPFGCQTGQTGVAGSSWQQNWRLWGLHRALRLVKILLCLSRS